MEGMISPRISPAGKPVRNREGFTLIELAAVVTILGIAMVVFVMKADSMSPGARLRAASRVVGSTVELAISDAAMKREQRFVVYRPGSGEVSIEREGEVPDENEVLMERSLPRDVQITDVEGLDTGEERTVLVVSASGRTAPHAVHLRNPAGEMTVEVYGLTGKMRYHVGHVALREFKREVAEESGE